VASFLRRELYQDFGMRELFEHFYRSILFSEAPPIPYREIVLTAKIMDEIFLQIYGSKPARRSKEETPVLT
jgi:hypothetical protein